MSVESQIDSRMGSYVDAVRITGLPLGTLRRLVSKNQIPHFRMGPRTPRFLIEDCDSELSLPRWVRLRAVLPTNDNRKEVNQVNQETRI